jgi:uncharacterized membrane protein YhaH (DUF805 family)
VLKLVGFLAGRADTNASRFLFLLFFVGLAMILAAQAKRFHDIDRSGAMCLWTFVPVLGVIFMAIVGCMDGTKGPNRFGEEPQRTMDEVLELKKARRKELDALKNNPG